MEKARRRDKIYQLPTRYISNLKSLKMLYYAVGGNWRSETTVLFTTAMLRNIRKVGELEEKNQSVVSSQSAMIGNA